MPKTMTKPSTKSKHAKQSKAGAQAKEPARIELSAATADRYDLYLRSVQEPEAEVEFFDRVFREEYGRSAMKLREDFCAAAAVCCEWVRSKAGRTAVGYDLDPETLDWGRRFNLSKLREDERRHVTLLAEDVRRVSKDKADVLAAENFSFFFFKTRDELRSYFEVARQNLADEGLLVLDMMGGPETWTAGEEDMRKIKIKDGEIPGIPLSKGVEANGLPRYEKTWFKYIWEQAAIDPITHDSLFYIHFRFKDGTELRRVFEYDWRMWTIPEVRELLLEAGFSRADVYWEGADDDGEGDGNFEKAETAECEPAWIAYVVGVK